MRMMSHRSSDLPGLRSGVAGLLLLFLLAGLAPLPARAEERTVVGRIRGTVRDRDDRPVAGLLLQLVAADRSGELRVTGTDEKGSYQFRDLPAGVYDLQASAEGYRPETKAGIEVRPPFQNIVDFRLTPAPSPAGVSTDAGTTTPHRSDGAPAVSVRGELTDRERHPVMEVSVTLIAHEGDGIYQAFSDVDGRFEVEGVPPGRYRAVIASPGHITLDLRSIEVPADGGLELSLTLVDYPLNFSNEDGDGRLPPERPIPAPEKPGGSPS